MAPIKEWLRREDLIIEELRSSIEDVIASYMDEAVSQFERNGQLVQPGHSAVTQMVDTLSIGWNEAVSFGSQRQLDMMEKQDGLTARAVLEYVSTYGLSRTRRIVNTTGDQLTRLVIRGQRQGLSKAEITRSIINAIPQIAKTRAKIIAETEIHSAAQFGSYNAAIRSGRLLTKVWNTVEDDRVRDFGSGSQFSHRLMQGVKSPLDIPFNVPHYTGMFEPIRFPGDPEGSAGNIINCRCIMTYEEK